MKLVWFEYEEKLKLVLEYIKVNFDTKTQISILYAENSKSQTALDIAEELKCRKPWASNLKWLIQCYMPHI